jgi:lysyl-tRNA synthetase class 2
VAVFVAAVHEGVGLLGELTFSINTDVALDSPDQRAGLILLAAMLLSFGFIRFSTRMIRAEVSWWPGNVTPGGVHIHHLVFGIVMMMVAGFVAFAVQPYSPWFEIAAGVFGVGMGLTLDEFALWLHLEDVYWSEEGRSSVDAVVFAAIIAGGYIVGFTPLDAGGGSTLAIVSSVAITLAFCAVVALKGKVSTAVIGMFIPPVAWVAALRLARPGSWWGRRRYAPGSGKLAKATARKARHDKRVRRFQDLIGGAPSLPNPRAQRSGRSTK